MMITLLTILLIIWTIFGLYMLYRNNWVYEKRTGLVFTNWEKYKQLQSYTYMLFHFWIWDVNKLFKK